MNLTNNDIEELRAAFAVCRIAGIDAAVITEDQVRGVSPTSKMAVISPANLSFDPNVKIGIGRISEFEKRLNIFAGAVEGEAKLNDSNEVSVLTLKAGKSKVQFRCTAEKYIKYPKENEDAPQVVITASKAEVQQISRALRTLDAENLTIAVGRDLTVRFECSSQTNEPFVMSLEALAEFEGDSVPIVQIYADKQLPAVLDAAARDSTEVTMAIGEYGSMTMMVKNQVLLVMPEANSEGEDDE